MAFRILSDRWLILLGAFLLAIWFASRPVTPAQGGTTYTDIRIISASSGSPASSSNQAVGV